VLGQAESSFKQGGKEAELKSLQELMLRVDAELKEVEEVEEKEEESMGHQVRRLLVSYRAHRRYSTCAPNS
jgi:hypothetical protein